MVVCSIYLLDGSKLSITVHKIKDDTNKKKKPAITAQELYTRIIDEHIIEKTYLKTSSQMKHTELFCLWVANHLEDKGS